MEWKLTLHILCAKSNTEDNLISLISVSTQDFPLILTLKIHARYPKGNIRKFSN